MPTYTCTTRTGLLDAAQRQAIAVAITTAHHAATGAPAYFVQVVFDEKDTTRRFIGGTAHDSHVWVRGDVRAGRSLAQRSELMQAIMRGVAAIAEVSETDVWVYLCELAPTDMIEYGHVLPKPGEEQAWFDALPSSLRDYLKGRGTGAEKFML